MADRSGPGNQARIPTTLQPNDQLIMAGNSSRPSDQTLTTRTFRSSRHIRMLLTSRLPKRRSETTHDQQDPGEPAAQQHSPQHTYDGLELRYARRTPPSHAHNAAHWQHRQTTSTKLPSISKHTGPPRARTISLHPREHYGSIQD